MFSALIANLDGLPVSPNAGTRAVVGDEDKVTNIRVVLFDTRDNGEVLYSWDMGIYTNGGTIDGPDVATGGADNFITAGRLVAYRDYDMVVLVNPSETLMKATVVGKDKSILDNAQTYNNNLTELIGQSSGSVTSATGLRFYDKCRFICQSSQNPITTNKRGG
ncbi:MAG: hypothetical protein LUH15_12725 [Tannerellaceae bacterium]|nr:hypothetical protein [Tannerellaceae bacterium]